MRRFLLLGIACLALGAASPARADFAQALAAYEQRSYAAALAEFRRLAEQEDADAQYMLGRMYARGEGTLQDYVQAHAWLNLAAARGHRLAGAERDSLQARMTSQQIAEAQSLARAFQPSAPPPAVAAPAPPPPPAVPASTPANRDEVAAIQRALAERGYDPGPADGVAGPRTRQAIRAYQEDAGLAVDGRTTRELAQALTSSETTPAPAPAPVATPLPAPLDPWAEILVEDDFRDGDFTRNPAWRVLSGEWYVDQRRALRSTVRPPQQVGSRPEDIAVAVLGTVLQQALGGAAPAREAAIVLPQRTSNAFALELRLSGEVSTGALDLGPYRGAEATNGYRLTWVKGDGERLELRHVDGGRTRLLAAYDGDLGLGDGRVRRLGWTRDFDGEMVVTLDRQELIRTGDQRETASFDGLVLRNLGGDYAIRQVEIRGTR
jgi:peptidoglycan hydrolase-like protein with peptidoglycan-binding domain